MRDSLTTGIQGYVKVYITTTTLDGKMYYTYRWNLHKKDTKGVLISRGKITVTLVNLCPYTWCSLAGIFHCGKVC